MAAPPILLVADDLSLIASVKRVLARQGYECLLATSAADAVIGWGHALPGLILLQPSVEGDRGKILLEELQRHPDARLLRVILLGETVPGFPWPVEPTPIEPDHLAQVIEETIRGGGEHAQWAVSEARAPATPTAPSAAQTPSAPEEWRVTRLTMPPEVSGNQGAAESPPGLDALEQRLFGDLVADLEVPAETPAAEAAPIVIPPDPAPQELDVLARAEQMIRISQAENEERRRVEEAELLQLKSAIQEALERAHQAEEQLRAEVSQRAAAENAQFALKDEIERTKAAHQHERELARLRHENELENLRAQFESTKATQAAQSAEHLALASAQLKAEAQQRGRIEAELTAAQQQVAELTAKVSTLEETAKRAEDDSAAREALTQTVANQSRRIEELETALTAAQSREQLTLVREGQPTLGIARQGKLGLETLTHLVMNLVTGHAEVRLELAVEGGARHLWFNRGQIVAAESTLEHETLISRARRDGLIDGRQENEMRLLKGATPREQLDALKARGFIRDIESVPLVQRYTEQVALDAFADAEASYRVADEAPPPTVLLATVPRPTLPMLAESLRRAVNPEEALQQLGGSAALPLLNESDLDLRALGFSERERKLLSWVDGESTVEDLTLASGLKPDVAFRTLRVAQLLGAIEVQPGAETSEPPSGELELQRLEAKFDEVQEADYFTILGLPRGAGTDDVRRAYERLSQVYDPIRFSGHPDPLVHQRAQTIANLLEEAARALEDDRRRLEYARHLLE